MTQPQTLLDKLWASHEVLKRKDGASLLAVDRHLVHEGSHHAFAKIGARKLAVAAPDLTFAIVDHYAPTRERAQIKDPQVAYMIKTLRSNARQHGLEIFDLHNPAQGIVHVVGPEQGITLPGLLINCGDSHTSTHGAFGALAFGIGATEVAHVLATQTIWQKKPKAMRITVNGTLGVGVSAKDIALNWIARLGTGGALGHAVEYAGSAIRALSMEARMTLCNLSIEGGARFGKGGITASRKDRQGAVAGANGSPRHRCIQIQQAKVRTALPKVARNIWGNGCASDNHRSGGQFCGNPVVAKQNRLGLGTVHNNDHHRIKRVCYIFDCTGCPACVLKSCNSVGVDVVAMCRKPRTQERASHADPHCAQAENRNRTVCHNTPRLSI